MTTYDDVRTRILTMRDIEHGVGGTATEIAELAAVCGPLATDFKQYLEEFGWLRVGTYELFGVGADVPPHLGVVDRAEELWSGAGMYQIPRELLPVYDSGGGWFYCVSKMHRGQPVVCWAHEYEEAGEPQPFDERYESWSQWVTHHILPYVG